MTTPTEHENRRNVAMHLADILWQAGATSADDIANLDNFVWQLAVDTLTQRQSQLVRAWEQEGGDLSGKPKPWVPRESYSPSDDTRIMVAGMIAYRSRPTPACGEDPIKGLPT